MCIICISCVLMRFPHNLHDVLSCILCTINKWNQCKMCMIGHIWHIVHTQNVRKVFFQGVWSGGQKAVVNRQPDDSQMMVEWWSNDDLNVWSKCGQIVRDRPVGGRPRERAGRAGIIIYCNYSDDGDMSAASWFPIPGPSCWHINT